MTGKAIIPADRGVPLMKETLELITIFTTIVNQAQTR